MKVTFELTPSTPTPSPSLYPFLAPLPPSPPPSPFLPPLPQASYWSSKKYEVHGDVYNAEGEKVHHLFGTWHEAMFCREEDERPHVSARQVCIRLSHQAMGQLYLVECMYVLGCPVRSHSGRLAISVYSVVLSDNWIATVYNTYVELSH